MTKLEISGFMTEFLGLMLVKYADHKVFKEFKVSQVLLDLRVFKVFKV